MATLTKRNTSALEQEVEGVNEQSPQIQSGIDADPGWAAAAERGTSHPLLRNGTIM